MFERIIKFISKDKLTIIYKLSVDLSLIGLIFFVGILLAESILPGIVVSHIGFTKIVLTVAGAVLLASFLGNRLDLPVFSDAQKNSPSGNLSHFRIFRISYFSPASPELQPALPASPKTASRGGPDQGERGEYFVKKEKTLSALIFFLILIAFNSLFRLNIFLNLVILITTIATGYFIFKVVIEKK